MTGGAHSGYAYAPTSGEAPWGKTLKEGGRCAQRQTPPGRWRLPTPNPHRQLHPRRRHPRPTADPAPSAAARSTAVPAGVTPSMAQFLEIKAANPDCMLFYRMGDFYELFFQDAVAAAEALGIVLTKRGKHLGEDIPMCGVPVHRADEYLQRLIAKGFRVAVCEQLEDPAEAKKRGHKAVVHRDVVRLVTPGTLTEDSLLDAKARNYLTALFKGPHRRRQGHRRAGLPRHLHRRVRGRRDRGRRFPRRDRAPRARRGDRCRCRARRHADLAKWIEIAGAAATPGARRLTSTAWPASGCSRRSSASPIWRRSAPSRGPSWLPSARCSSTWS